MGKLSVVVGGQYGSEGKGAITAWLGQKSGAVGEEVVGVRVAGPNAGHTVIGRKRMPMAQHVGIKDLETFLGEDYGDREWKLRSVPVLAVSNPEARLYIAAGSEIDDRVLQAELDELDAAGYGVRGRLYIDGQATVLSQLNIKEEQERALTEKLGSTAKGIGSARADRIWREAEIWAKDGFDTARMLRGDLAGGAHVIIEGTQGYGLGLHAGEYPYCTSSDCRAIDFLAMAGLSPWGSEVTELDVWVVLRTRPIRVAGNSGRLENETTWEGLGLPEERTTVTNKVRRVGEWDGELAARAIEANGGSEVKVAITMLDQMFPEIAGVTQYAAMSADALKWIEDRSDELGVEIAAVGTSPSTVVELGA